MTVDEVVAIVSSLWGLDLARCLKGHWNLQTETNVCVLPSLCAMLNQEY